MCVIPTGLSTLPCVLSQHGWVLYHLCHPSMAEYFTICVIPAWLSTLSSVSSQHGWVLYHLCHPSMAEYFTICVIPAWLSSLPSVSFQHGWVLGLSGVSVQRRNVSVSAWTSLMRWVVCSCPTCVIVGRHTDSGAACWLSWEPFNIPT